METLALSFMRVQRGFNTARKVTSLLEHVESNGQEDLTPEDCLGVLDLPDDDTVASNMISVTALSRSAHMQRAAESPELLTEVELDLLLDRNWVGMTNIEQRAQMSASDQLLQILREHERATMERLELLRKQLYDHTNEEKALESALVELKRRGDAEATLRYNTDLQDALASFKGLDWAKTFLEEERATKPGGFTKYIDPLAAVHFDLEHCFVRTDAVLMFARTSMR